MIKFKFISPKNIFDMLIFDNLECSDIQKRVYLYKINNNYTISQIK